MRFYLLVCFDFGFDGYYASLFRCLIVVVAIGYILCCVTIMILSSMIGLVDCRCIVWKVSLFCVGLILVYVYV